MKGCMQDRVQGSESSEVPRWKFEDRKGPVTTEGEEEGPGGRQGGVRVQDGLERRALVLLK